MRLRSLLFVPGDRPERFDKAAASGADAVILDLEDSVSADNKPLARQFVPDWIARNREILTFVRINPLSSEFVDEDLACTLEAQPHGIVLPKAEGARSLRILSEKCGDFPCPPVLPIATEVPAAIFELGSYREVADALCGLTWGAEDLPASIGAASAREDDGAYTAPIEMARSLMLFAAHAAGVDAIETVFPAIDDIAGLKAYVARARRDGFTGMMAIHPAQVKHINAGFEPSEEEVGHALEVIASFRANPSAGALRVNGQMVDRPHLALAEKILQRSSRTSDS